MDKHLATLDAEVSQAILSALTGESIIEPPKNKISDREQIEYIMKNASTLSLADRKNIGKILIINDRKSSMLSSADGTIINLDQQPTHVIDQIYEFVLYKTDV